MNVWSRRILGAEVHERECRLLARDFFDRICRNEGIESGTSAILHSDNGMPMRSYKLAAKMKEIGISLSFSRPSVSNDNAYPESWFRTLKYHQSHPTRQFRSLDAVRCWVECFVEWYNGQHCHSSIKCVTPNQQHSGEAHGIFTIRQQTYERAREENPRRWSVPTRCWKQPEVFKMNYPRLEKSNPAKKK
jgi:putative transposase